MNGVARRTVGRSMRERAFTGNGHPAKGDPIMKKVVIRQCPV
jgi:hypothetical protein